MRLTNLAEHHARHELLFGSVTGYMLGGAFDQTAPDRHHQRPPANIQRRSPVTLNGHSNRSLQKGHRDDKAVALGGADKNSFQSSQRPRFNAYPLPGVKKGPRF